MHVCSEVFFFYPFEFCSESASNVQVVVGRHTIDGSSGNQYTKEYKVKKMILHPEYDSESVNNDVAIMYLDGTVDINAGVEPIELSDKATVNYFNKECIITGWGALSEGKPFGTYSLIQVSMSIVSDAS